MGIEDISPQLKDHNSSKMKVAIFVLALVGAILAVPQDKPDIVEERQEEPIADRQDEPIAERQDEPIADRMYGTGCANGPDPNKWCSARNKQFCTRSTSYKSYFLENCKKLCNVCSGGGCKSDEFRCRQGYSKFGESFKLGSRTYAGGCVPDYYACDGWFDCNDGSDEDTSIDQVAAKCE